MQLNARDIYQPDGTFLGRCPEIDGETFVDTNCLFLMSTAFAAVAAWYLVPPTHSLMGDRFVWKTIKDMSLRRAHTGLPTIAYRTTYQFHFDYFGVVAPAGAKQLIWTPCDDERRHAWFDEATEITIVSSQRRLPTASRSQALFLAARQVAAAIL